MTIGVDARSNSLIVLAPEPLFQEVEELVTQLDNKSIVADETVRVVSIRKGNPALIQKALAAMVGDSARIGMSSSQAGSMSRGSPTASLASMPSPGPSNGQNLAAGMASFGSLSGPRSTPSSGQPGGFVGVPGGGAPAGGLSEGAGGPGFGGPGGGQGFGAGGPGFGGGPGIGGFGGGMGGAPGFGGPSGGPSSANSGRSPARSEVTTRRGP